MSGRRSTSGALAAAAAWAMVVAPTPAGAGIFQQCKALSAPIPDLGSAQATFNTNSAKAPPPKGSKVKKVSVSFKITHPSDEDLTLRVTSPAGRAVTLAAGRGGTGDDYGTGTNCAAAFTSFADEAPDPIASGVAPFEGSFKPETPLAALKGSKARGMWTVTAFDGALLNSGVLEAVRLNVESKNPNRTKKK